MSTEQSLSAVASRLSAICLTAGLMASPMAADAHEPKASSQSGALVSEVARPAVAVVEQFSSALQAGDLKRAGSLLADDVLILEGGGAEHSRDEYLGGHAPHDAAFLKDAHIQVKQRTARSSSDMAWVGTESELHTSQNGKPVALLSTETMVLRRDADGWRIVHIHWSSQPVKTDANQQP